MRRKSRVIDPMPIVSHSDGELEKTPMNRRQFSAGLSAIAATATLATAAHADPHPLKFLNTEFGDIAYRESGKGEAALFLHGFPLNSYQWRHQLTRLAGLRRCLAPDFMGLGHTKVREGQDVSPASQAAMLAGFLDGLKVTSVDIVANDSGIAVAQLFAAAHPERVRSLLLTNGDTEKDCPPPALVPVIDLAKQNAFVSSWLAPWLADKNLARSDQGLGGMTFTRPSELADITIETYLAPLVANPAATHSYALALEANALAGIEPKLKALEVPVRIIWGTGDPIFSPESPDYLARLFQKSRGVKRIDGAKLFFPEEYPDLIEAELRALWA